MPESDPRPLGEPAHPSHATAALSRAVGTLLGRGGILVVSFVFAVMVARILHPSSRGNFALLQALNGLTVVAANFAIGGAVVFHVGKDLLSAARARGAAAMLALLSGAVAATLLVPVCFALRGSLFPGVAPLLIVGAILLATPLLVREYVGGTLIALGRPGRYAVSHAAQPVGAVLVLVAVVVLGRGSLGAVVLGWTVGIALSGATALLMTFSLLGPRLEARREDMRSLGRFGLRTYPALLTRFLNLRLDQFLVRLLASAAVLGQYAVAVGVGELMIQIPIVMLWAFSGTISAAEREEAGSLVAQFCRWTLVLLVLAGLTIALLSPIGVPVVFGSRYRPAVTSVLLLVPGMVCYAPATIIAEFFIVQRGRPGMAAMIAGSSLLTSTLLNFPLTPSLGAAGASIASTISYAVMLLAAVLLFARDTGQSPREIFAVTRGDLRALASAFRRPRPLNA